MDDLPSRRVIAMPEILCLIVEALDTPTLRTVSLVCKAWHHYTRQILWRQLIIPKDWFSLDLSPLWPILERQGDVVRALSLELAAATKRKPHDMGAVQQQLANLLSRLPNLESLNAQLPGDLHSSIVRTIAEHAKQLKEFETNIVNWEPEDMTTLLAACPNLRMIGGHRFSGDMLEAIAKTQPTLKRIDCIHPTFEDDDLIAFATQLPDLVQLCVSMNQELSARALIAISQHCHKIEHLGLQVCLGLHSVGFQAIFQVSSNLRVLDLGPSEVNDKDITLVAAQCPKLETLKLPFCANLTHMSILDIVQSCRHLKHLDISWSERVLFLIFDTATPWVCEGLRYLDISGIHGSFIESTTAPMLLPNMYQQLSRLKQLEQLKLSGYPFPLRLLELGRSHLPSLKRLEGLDISKLKEPIPWKDIIEIGNWFPHLKEFQFRSCDVIPPSSLIQITTTETANEEESSPSAQPQPMKVPGSGAGAEESPISPRAIRRRSILEEFSQAEFSLDNPDSSATPPPSKRKRSRPPSPPVEEEYSNVASSSTEQTTPNFTDTNMGSVLPGDEQYVSVNDLVKSTLRSGLVISFRLSGEDEEGSEEDIPFSGGFGGMPF